MKTALVGILLLLAAAMPALAKEKVALVIGNAAYKEAPLRNSVNDARAMAAKLRSLGFTVISRENGTKLEMERAVADFGDLLTEDSVSLFYFAGHGLQVDGRNFLVPVDARIATPQRVRLETLDVELVLDQMAAAGSRLNFVILDACRNNPFERRFRAIGGGLAQITAPQGTLIAYATAPGKVAADGTADHGLYTSELLKALDIPGLQVEEVFKRVRVEVARLSSGSQVPWEASSLTGTFYFRPPPPQPTPPVPPAVQATNTPAAAAAAPAQAPSAPSPPPQAPSPPPSSPAVALAPAPVPSIETRKGAAAPLRFQYFAIRCEDSRFQVPGNTVCAEGPPLVSRATRKSIAGSMRVSAAGSSDSLSYDLRAFLPGPGGNIAEYSYDQLRQDFLREITRFSPVARGARDFVMAGHDTLLPFVEDMTHCAAFDRAGPRQGSGYAYSIQGVVCSESRSTQPTVEEISALLKQARLTPQ